MSLQVTKESGVAHVQLARSKKLNTMTRDFFADIKSTFESLSRDGEVRVILLSAQLQSKLFTAGLDLKETSGFPQANEDPAREAWRFIPTIEWMQSTFTAIEKCAKPVIVAIHGLCIGGGIDLISACDIRLCSKDAAFTIKEIDIGLAADLGTLQRFPKIVGNASWARELCFTGRKFDAAEAYRHGFVSRIYESKEALFGSLE